MRVRDTAIPGMKVLTPARHEDERGFFTESWSRARLGEHGIDVDFVQDNHSFSARPGTVRGLHFQRPPHVQVKLVWVVTGSLVDVVVDLRRGSPTRGAWRSVEVSARLGNQVLVPAGCAHGFCTLEPATHVLYKVDAPWAPEAEAGIRWDDPELAIEWPELDPLRISEKDRSLPSWSQLSTPFDFDPDSPIHGRTS